MKEPRGHAPLPRQHAPFRQLVEAAGSPILVLDRYGRVTAFNAAAARTFGRARADVVGLPCTALFSGSARQKVRGELRRLRTGDANAQFDTAIARADGSHSVVLWNMTRIPGARNGGIVAIGHDITALRGSQERLVGQTRHLLGLTRIDRAIIALQPLEIVAQTALRHLQEVLNCHGAALVALDEAAGTAVRLASVGRPGQVPRRVRAIRPGDLTDGTWPEGPDAPLLVPLVANAARVGTLIIRFAGGIDRLTLLSLEWIGQVADRLALALANARLFEAEREARRLFQAASARLVEVQETERRRIARELHDDIGQGLTALQLDLKVHGRGRATGDADAARALAMVHQLIGRVRNLSLDLRPAVLDDLGLVAALISFTDRYSTQTGIQVTFEHRGVSRRFHPEVETAAFRIVQEALTNVARHAGVPRASLRLWADRTTMRIVIEDAGRGFDPLAAATTASSGLSSMRERAAMLDGRVTVQSSPGSGTTVTAILPLSGARRAHRAARRVRA